MFAVAIWDKSGRQLFLARDRMGIKPLYIYDNGRFGLGSPPSSRRYWPTRPCRRDLDHDALGYYFRYGYVAAPATTD